MEQKPKKYVTWTFYSRTRNNPRPCYVSQDNMLSKTRYTICRSGTAHRTEILEIIPRESCNPGLYTFPWRSYYFSNSQTISLCPRRLGLAVSSERLCLQPSQSKVHWSRSPLSFTLGHWGDTHNKPKAFCLPVVQKVIIKRYKSIPIIVLAALVCNAE